MFLYAHNIDCHLYMYIGSIMWGVQLFLITVEMWNWMYHAPGSRNTTDSCDCKMLLTNPCLVSCQGFGMSLRMGACEMLMRSRELLWGDGSIFINCFLMIVQAVCSHSRMYNLMTWCVLDQVLNFFHCDCRLDFSLFSMLICGKIILTNFLTCMPLES
jgi:hypothetical protein